MNKAILVFLIICILILMKMERKKEKYCGACGVMAM